MSTTSVRREAAYLPKGGLLVAARMPLSEKAGR
jgi:hypothetical protein